MVAYSFKTRFVEPILAGTKRQTIRAQRTGRSRHAHPGEELQLFTAMRTKQCRLIGRVACQDVSKIKLVFYGQDAVIMHDTEITTPKALDVFARSDGFKDWDMLKAFWFHEHGTVDEFIGVRILWGDLQ